MLEATVAPAVRLAVAAVEANTKDEGVMAITVASHLGDG